MQKRNFPTLAVAIRDAYASLSATHHNTGQHRRAEYDLDIAKKANKRVTRWCARKEKVNAKG